MTKKNTLIQQQIESYTKLLTAKKSVNSYEVFAFRKELRELCKNDKPASQYLEQVIKETEISLQNILNFYPHN